MNKISRKLTSFIAISCLAPNIVFGATGDIYDFNNNIKYSQSDTDIFKQNIKSGVSKENFLYVEQPDGKLLSYKDMQRAKRQAIVEVVVSKGIDLKDTDALSKAIVQYASEIQEAQNIKLASLSKVDVPVKSVLPTTNDNSLGDIDYEFWNDNGNASFKIKSATQLNRQAYTGTFSLTIIQGDSVTQQLDGVDLNNVVSFTNANDTVILVKKTQSDSSYIKLDFSKRTEDWRISEELSKLDVGITGNKSDGYTLAWDVQVTEQNSSGGTQQRTENLKLDIVDKYSQETITTIPLTTLTGNVSIAEFSTIEPLIVLKDTVSSKELLISKPLVSNYEVADKIQFVVDTSQSVSRRDILTKAIPVDYPKDQIFVEVRQGESIAKEYYMDINSNYHSEFTEGLYTVNAYVDESKSVKLGSVNIDFKWIPIDDLDMLVQFAKGDEDVPWNTKNPILVEFRPVCKSEHQVDEIFRVELVDVSDNSVVSTQELKFGDKISVPCKPNGDYKINVYSNGNLIYSENYFLPFHGSVAQGIYASYTKSSSELKVYLNDLYDNYTTTEYFTNIKSVNLRMGISPNEDGLFYNIGDIPVSLFKSGEVIIPNVVVPNNGAVARFDMIDKYGNKTSFICLVSHLELNTLSDPVTKPDDSVEPPAIPELPEMSPDLEFEEVPTVGFLNDSMMLLNDETLMDDESQTPDYQLEKLVLPNINSKESDEDSELELDDLDDLPTLDFE